MSLDLDPTPLAGTTLAAGQMLPDVVFTDARTGRRWRPSQLRQRAAQVLCFLHDDCRPCDGVLARLDEREADLRWSDAEVRAVRASPTDGPFPVLLDPEGRVCRRLLGPDGRRPTLIVTDRYTAVADAYPAPEHAFPEVDTVLRSLRLLACDCE
ncbi:MAG: hypothetical protein WD080_03145 [Egibacteraceae bacterium]